jgi:hypothetical protein
LSAGGNRGDVPIPLVCDLIPEKYLKANNKKEIFSSFVGSLTHPIRDLLFDLFKSDSDFYFNAKRWAPAITNRDLENFFEKTQQSKFTLCPRGYGKTSFRLYETFQLNSVPVYISDEFWLPFTNEIMWEDICVMVRSNQVPDLKKILNSITDEKYNSMLTNGKKIWNEYFEINNLCKKIFQIYAN